MPMNSGLGSNYAITVAEVADELASFGVPV
jgi:hypothetical protein